MNEVAADVRTDEELLNLARSILSEKGFYTETSRTSIDLVLAENSLFVIGVAAVSTTRDLIKVEPFAFAALAERLEGTILGPKKWDTYLVLLTQEKSIEDDEITRDLYAINYDTTRVRRIAHTGVNPTPEAVAHALAPFVEPRTSISPSASQGDALESLLHALVSGGVDEELAQRAVAAFGQGAQLDDVL